MIGWPLVFCMNMVVPLLIGLGLTNASNRIGLFLASASLFALGWIGCYRSPRFARKLIVGAGAIAISQVFPVLQIVAGFFALAVAEKSGMSRYDDNLPTGSELSDVGGFVVTLIVGCILLGFSLIIGLVLSSLLPSRWFQPPTYSAKEETDGSR